mmetsp:Transcript_15303/g.47400  ORF Transcript_15303/g.47400 Transcript_15303/m.47400 type:complete len:142 (-) Transcript_15303:44-469(-)
MIVDAARYSPNISISASRSRRSAIFDWRVRYMPRTTKPRTPTPMPFTMVTRRASSASRSVVVSRMMWSVMSRSRYDPGLTAARAAAAEAGLDAEQLEYLRTTVVCVLATDQPALKKQLLPVLAQVLKLPPGDERFEQLMAE